MIIQAYHHSLLPHAPIMKRARPAPNVFADSSSDSEEPRQRFKPFSTTAQTDSPKTKSKDADQEDTLEAFMLNLTERTTEPTKQPPHKHTVSSDEEDIPSKGDVTAEHSMNHALDQSHARDLTLPPVDYTKVKLPLVVRHPYEPPPGLLNQTKIERTLTLTSLGAKVANGDDVYPIPSFHSVAPHLPPSLLTSITSSYTNPTPIQSVAIPALLSSRDVIGIAKTGSGKTLAYSIPMLSHIARQPGRSTSGRGPSSLVVAPTRELALQITSVIRKLGASVCPVIGGCGKYEQYKKIRDGGSEVVVATPGRLIDMLKMRACGMTRCSFIVLDEADRMLDMGFGPQVEAILGVIRDDAQRVMFSATFPKVVERLAKGLLKRAVRIEIKDSEGHGAMVNENVKEVYVDVVNPEGRLNWLQKNLAKLMDEGLVILFCSTRGDAAEVANRVRAMGHPAACVHGETDAGDRHAFVKMFKSGEISILVTTDVSARGLDILNVKNVVNCGCAKSWEWHVHRVGRTGRAGRSGTAYTLVTRGKGDITFAQEAVEAYRKGCVGAPDGLEDIVKDVDCTTRWRGRGRGTGKLRSRGRWR